MSIKAFITQKLKTLRDVFSERTEEQKQEDMKKENFLKLKKAIYVGNLEDVEKYSKLTDVNKKDYSTSNETILFDVVRERKDPKIVPILKDAGLDINEQNHYGSTALMEATELNDLEMIKVLTAEGADVSIKNVYDNDAISLAKSEEAKLFLEEAKKQQEQSNEISLAKGYMMRNRRNVKVPE